MCDLIGFRVNFQLPEETYFIIALNIYSGTSNKSLSI